MDLTTTPLKSVATTSAHPRAIAIDYLRTALTLLVVAHHSAEAYTTWATFDMRYPLRSSAPVVDKVRWIGFDYFENFNDVFFMSLMFFISGLFVYSAWRRQGTVSFLRSRFLRLGVPFGLAIVVLMPMAYYAAEQAAGRDESFWEFYKQLLHNGFAVGPPWFIWVLLLFNVLVVSILPLVQRWLRLVERLMAMLRSHVLLAAAGVFALATLAYYPLLARYGPDAWPVLVTSPFTFQASRIGLYALWFGFGMLVGAPGLASGLLAASSSLTRRWPLWAGGSLLISNLLWFSSHSSLLARSNSAAQSIVVALWWVASCVASCFGCLALFHGVRLRSRWWMNSLSRSAYSIYLVHYVYVVWGHFLLLPLPWPLTVKFSLVLLESTLLSWLTAQLLLKIPWLKRIL